MRNLQVAHLVGKLVHVCPASVEERLVVTPHHEAFLLLQPPWVTSVLPFSTAIRTGTEDDEHILFLSGLHEFTQVVFVGSPVPLSGSHFVEVPEDIGCHRVESHGLHHLQTVTPIGSGNTLVVHFTGIDGRRFAIVEELAVCNGKGVLTGRSRTGTSAEGGKQ